MAVVNSNAISSRLPIPGEGAGGGQVKTQKCIVAVTVGLTTTDTMPLFYLPPNALVMGIVVKAPAFGGATTLNIGDNGYGSVVADVDRYLAANTVTTAGGVVNAIAATGAFFRTGPQKLLVTAAFAAGTVATAGSLEVAIQYTVEEPQL